MVLEFSGSAPRVADSNHVDSSELAAVVRPGQKLCQPGVVLPPDGAAVRIFVDSHDRPMPRISLTLTDVSGRVVDTGVLPAGRPQGFSIIPLRHPGPAGGTLCLTVGGHDQVAIGGSPESLAPILERVDGKPQPAAVALWYMRAGSESWWQLMPTLARRFGYGKWGFLGGWTFVAGAVLLVLVWLAVLRLLWTQFA